MWWSRRRMWKLGSYKEFLKGNTWETGHWECLGINGSMVLTRILRKQVVRLGITDIFDSWDLTCIVEFPVSNLWPNADYLNKIFPVFPKFLLYSILKGFLRGNLRERGHWEGPDADGRIILRWIFRKWEGVVRTGWSWLRIGTGGGHLWVRWWTLGFQKCGEFLD